MEPLTRRRHLLLLLILVPLLATVASHVVFFRRFPWQPGYRFPLPYFLTVSTVMLSCWTVNLAIFRKLDRALPFSVDPVRRIGRQVLLGGLATMTTFFLVFPGAVRLYTGQWPNAVQLTSGIFVCITIATLINGGYVGLYLLQAYRLEKEQAARDLSDQISDLRKTRPPAAGTPAIWVETVARRLALQPEEIAYFYSTQGVVLLVRTDAQQLTTRYNSFTELEKLLPSTLFFQLNRQFIVSLAAIRSVQDDSNRKLLVSLAPALHKQDPVETVTVSRYRSAEFKRWLNQLTAA
ncbi:LytTR family DNA-binding domain-containing protein [Larkinella soli]|uniref:LytTR family DNA-binding domain-containing protein n=1 Tax=Larkinella soli TaxID=1770527 RepID=UPI000FFB3D1A|nr:LytTR family DNA-binding domain-containing protein [Larkinella soli]